MKITPELLEELKTLKESMLDDNGWEMPNPVPHNLDIGLDRPPTLQEQIQRVLRTELSRQAEMQGRETFDESVDFEVTDDFDADPPNTKYTVLEEEWVIPKGSRVKKQVDENKENENEAEGFSADVGASGELDTGGAKSEGDRASEDSAEKAGK